ncbi:MAG: hypothetical protein HZA61_05360 [Candidatus Eisenbacteria bacterium]|uniref:Uncharacterized protein n=1 Tax=Eiseniibacteriota bacterium TaxID=2212470 RepID=A0A933SCI1_UNCEI|nr:hypothetical protein [Candidatus Eisenbacteria bacterium]
MAFRAEVRRALSQSVGLSLAQAFAAPKVTVIVADAAVSERDVVALSELAEALVRVGTSRGRCMLLLSHAGPAAPAPAVKSHAKQLRATLGMPVVVHDTTEKSDWIPGELDGVGACALDDELREAEAIVLVGRWSRRKDGAVHGGPALLLPGLADPATRARWSALADGGARDAATRAVTALVPVDYALIWDASDPPRVRAGSGAELFAALEAEGWPLPE